jgi:chloramphenicol 3-O-phosphotransferase
MCRPTIWWQAACCPLGATTMVHSLAADPSAVFAGFHRCLPALAAAGNDLIVDHVIEYRRWRDDLAAAGH